MMHAKLLMGATLCAVISVSLIAKVPSQDKTVTLVKTDEVVSSPVSDAKASDTMDHAHSMVQIPEGVALPSLRINLSKDAMSGFNLEIGTENFELEPPEAASCCNDKVLEGHAHIFINGEKIYRAYSRYIHLPKGLFKEGINQVMVSLNDHDHNTWSKGPRMVMSTLVIDTTQEAFLKHRFEPAIAQLNDVGQL